jgi:hypothetical protein
MVVKRSVLRESEVALERSYWPVAQLALGGVWMYRTETL